MVNSVADGVNKMRIRWFLYPAYYENKTWDEQFRDPHIVGHFSTFPSALKNTNKL